MSHSSSYKITDVSLGIWVTQEEIQGPDTDFHGEEGHI